MTLHRRPLGRGRWMAALGGVLMVVGSVLPWWQVGGTPGITAQSGTAWRAAASSSSWSGSRRWRSSPCRMRPAIARSVSIAG